MTNLHRLRLRPANTVEGFADTFEAGLNCKSIQYEDGAYMVFRPLTTGNQSYKYDLIITAHGHGCLQWDAECRECGELLPGKKQLASHLFHKHGKKLTEEKANGK